MNKQDSDGDERINRLEAQLDRQTGYILQMIREIGEMRVDFNKRFDALELQVGNMENQFINLKEEVRSLKREFTSFGKALYSLRAEVDETEDRVAVLEGNRAAD